jgi:hypothetical protein
MTPVNNRIFKYAFLGVVLLIAALGFTVNHVSNISMLELSSTLVASTLSASSFSFLYKAIKSDKRSAREADKQAA